MSAIPLEDAISRGGAPIEARSKLPPKALLYFLVVAAGAIAVTAPFLSQIDRHTGSWLEFAILATSVAFAQFFVVRTPGNKSYHTTGVFLIAAVLLLPPGLVALIPLIQHVPEWLRSRGKWYVQSTNLCVYTIATMAAWGSAHLILGAESLLQSDDVRFALAGTARLDRARRAQLGAARPDDPLRQRASDAPDLLVPDAVDGVRLRRARSRARRVLDGEPVARSLRNRPAAPDSPGALGAAAAGRGPCRPQDRPLQRALLRVGADGGARSRAALRAAAVADHGRPRPPARDQQHLRPPCRRCGAEGHRGGLPRRAAPLRRARTLRRRGVLDPAAGDAARAGARDRGADPARDRRAIVRRRDLERADPRDRLDRRRRLPEGRTGSERAHPPGGSRRVPRQAAGAQPRPQRELRAAPDARRPQCSARCRPGGRRPSRAAGARPGGDARAGAPPHGAHHERTALPPAFDPSRPARRPRDHHGRRGGRAGHPLRYLDRHHRPARRDRARRRGGGARARARRRLDLRQRRRCACGRGTLRPPERARRRGRDLCRPVERGSRSDPQGALQRRHADALVARGGVRLHARLRRRASPSS